MPQTVDHALTAPSDERLRTLRLNITRAEDELDAARVEMATNMRAALEGGASMTHVARTLDWSRQWCYNALSRWRPS